MRIFLLIILCLLMNPVFSMEYFVGPDGNDSNSGNSRLKALKTISRAVKHLQPGDTLTILPSEYLQQALNITCKGTADKPITIRGTSRDFCIIKSWVRIDSSKFSRVPGKKFVFVAPQKSPVYNMTETDNRLMLQPAPAIEDMDQFRGSYFYDGKKRQIYVHCSDGLAPDKHSLKTTVLPGYIFLLKKAKHVIIKDLTFCGSYPEIPRYAGWGVPLRAMGTTNLIIDNCAFFFNCGGVSISSRSLNSSVKNCLFSNNQADGYGEIAQLIFSGNSVNNLAENNIIFDGNNHGLRFYSGAKNCTAIGNIIVNDRIGLYFKASRGKRLAERNVVVNCKVTNYSDLMGGRPIKDLYNTFASPSNVFDPNKSNLIFSKKLAPKFCDPDSLDFRLQGDSSFIGKGPDGKTPGAYQYKKNVFFVSPDFENKIAESILPSLITVSNKL